MTELPGASVVIATRQRSEPLSECLRSIRRQVVQPVEVIVVDSSEEDATRMLCEREAGSCGFPLVHIASPIRSAALQRNIGARRAGGSVLVFLDDDVVLEPRFLMELLAPFQGCGKNGVAGVGGTITNEIPAPMSRANRCVLHWILGADPGANPGLLIGPAVHISYAAGSGELRPVDWLPGSACAYRKEIFAQGGFGETFDGYSFMEDVELSARVGRRYPLMQATGARLSHKGLGSSSHTDWVAHGESRILNRQYVMAGAMGKNDAGSLLRLFCYELVYSTAAGLWNAGRRGAVRRTGLQLVGRLRGAAKILFGKSPHYTLR